ncbi:hypothetical protein ES705_49271 [subsurface metagenome]
MPFTSSAQFPNIYLISFPASSQAFFTSSAVFSALTLISSRLAFALSAISCITLASLSLAAVVFPSRAPILSPIFSERTLNGAPSFPGNLASISAIALESWMTQFNQAFSKKRIIFLQFLIARITRAIAAVTPPIISTTGPRPIPNPTAAAVNPGRSIKSGPKTRANPPNAAVSITSVLNSSW